MKRVEITAINTGKTVSADVISISDKKLIVVLDNTVIRLVLTRTDKKKPYVGKMHGVEFSCNC